MLDGASDGFGMATMEHQSKGFRRWSYQKGTRFFERWKLYLVMLSDAYALNRVRCVCGEFVAHFFFVLVIRPLSSSFLL